jgi:hypothetical protein
VVLFSAPLGAAAVERSESANRLDHPFLDVVLLEPAGPDDAPRLLVLDAIPPAPGSVHLSILERDRSWLETRSLTVGFPPTPGIDQPWLVRLDPALVAMIVAIPGTRSTTVVLLATDGGPGGDDLMEVERADLPDRVIASGVADVDGDGSPELVLGAGGLRGSDACSASTIWVVRPGGLATPTAHEVPGLVLGGGVLGRFDDVAGDDLLSYALGDCLGGPSAAPATIQALRLVDGTPIVTGLDVPWQEAESMGSPLLVDLDPPAETGRDEVVIRGRDGLSVLDPSDDWRVTPIAGVDTIPLAVTGDPADNAPTVTWMDFEVDAIATSAGLSRGSDGAPTVGPRVSLAVDGPPPQRLAALAAQAERGLRTGRPAVVWQGTLGEEGCQDLLVQGARRPCGSAEFEPGAAWIGTRPLATIGEGSGRRLLVAAGLESDIGLGLPAVPTPDATGFAGWWRYGASAPFALAELRAGDAVYYNEFPVPRSSVERVSDPDATTALPGFTGTRLLVRAAATDDAEAPTGDVAVEDLFAGEAPGHELRTIFRIPVPPGLDSGRDGAAIRVPLSRATQPDGEPAGQWGLRVVPLNDWGEVGPLAAGLVQRDGTGPTLVVGEPFTTPVWPLPARLTGSAEPGSTVVIDGVGEAELDRRGGFEFQTTLAPWPQTIRITATDPSGNRTVRDLSIVGGVDYRRFPWTVIAAVVLVGAVALSGWRSAARRTASVGGAAAAGGASSVIEEWPMAELEELPEGAGLPRGDAPPGR